MSSGVQVRRAEAPDWEAVTELFLRARAAAVPAIPPVARTSEDVRSGFGVLVLEPNEVWVAEHDGSGILGMMVLSGLPSASGADRGRSAPRQLPQNGWVEQLYIDPGWTAGGLGGRLLDRAKERRPGGLQLWVFLSNRGAIRFYARHGFVEVERTDGATNEERSPDARYRWEPR